MAAPARVLGIDCQRERLECLVLQLVETGDQTQIVAYLRLELHDELMILQQQRDRACKQMNRFRVHFAISHALLRYAQDQNSKQFASHAQGSNKREEIRQQGIERQSRGCRKQVMTITVA